MEAIITTILTTIIGGGPGAIVAILIGIIGFLLWDRRNLTKNIKEKEDKFDKIVQDYHSGQITITEAITSLKMILIEIKSAL